MFDKDNDLPDLQGWVEHLGQVLPHQICLPLGAMICDAKGKKYACGFLYLSTDTPVSVLEWVYFNPVISTREKVLSLKHIIECLEKCAVAEKHPVMFAGSASPGLTRIFEKAGWTATIKNMTHLIKIADTKE